MSRGKLHILFISSWYPTRNHLTHGIFNRYFAEAVSALHEVTVIHVSSEDKPKQDFEVVQTKEGNLHSIHVYYKKVRSNLPGISAFIKRKRYLKAFELGYNTLLLHRSQPQLIHLNVVLPAGLGALHLARKYALPLVVNENWSGYSKEDGNYKGVAQKFFTRKIIAAASRILPTSTYLKDAMLSHGLTGSYEVVPNVVNVQRFSPSTTKTTHSGTRFIHVSSLTDREKNISGLLRAFAGAVKKNTEIQLNIVGDGPERKDLEAYSRSLGLEQHVQFSGRITGDHLVNALRASDALVMFSHFETFCLVIAEAFATGLPVITSAAGAIPSYMTPELGLMVPPRDENALTEALLQFASSTQHFDSSVIRHFAVQHFSYEIVAEQLDRIYHDVLQHTTIDKQEIR